MKRYFLLILSLFAVVSYAQTIPEGFYRVQNFKTKRVMFVQDDQASIVVQSGTADLGAIVPWLESGKSSICDPQSVIYVRPKGDGYDLVAQGMSTYQKIQLPIKITKYGTTDTYRCSADKGGFTLYLSDQTTDLTKDKGKLGTTIPDNDADYSRWYANAISTSGNNYFGVKPTIEVDGKYYASFYAGFSFKVASSGMKVYIVSDLGDGKATIKEVTDQEIPASTPVIFECSSKNPSDNKLQLIGVGGSPLSQKLTGVFFCNYPTFDDEASHKNITVYNSSTMRILGKSSTGKLAFVKAKSSDLIDGTWEGASVLCIPANTAVLKASADKLSDEMIVTTSTSGLESVSLEVPDTQVVYSVVGVKVGEYSNDVNLTEILPKGIYVVNNKKFVVK